MPMQQMGRLPLVVMLAQAPWLRVQLLPSLYQPAGPETWPSTTPAGPSLEMTLSSREVSLFPKVIALQLPTWMLAMCKLLDNLDDKLNLPLTLETIETGFPWPLSVRAPVIL